jgi:membrane protein CcdC involved in cytochrome C biogenesis
VPHLITPLLLGLLFVWAIYRRARRSFGRQPLEIGRLKFRIGFLSLIAALMLYLSFKDLPSLAGLLGGLTCGALLSRIGLRHTKFEADAGRSYYTPHTYIGLILMALVVSRIMLRVVIDYGYGATATAPVSNPLAPYRRSPITLGILGLLIGYFILFHLGVLRKSRTLSASSPAS